MSKLKTSFLSSHWLVLIAPLLAFPFMINLRVFPLVAPNEEPKWAVLTVCALWIGLAISGLLFQRKSPLTMAKPSIPTLLLTIYLLILGIGVFVGPNTTEGMIRFAFWVFCALIFWLSSWAAQHEKKWLNALIWSISIGSFIFSLRYWESYFLDYGKPNYNIAVLFSPIGHINFTGDVLIMLLPMLLWILATTSSPILRVLNWFSAATLATVLLVASSRGALGGMFIAALLSLIFFIKHYKLYLSAPNLKISALLIGSSLLVSIVTYYSLPYHYRDIARISATAAQATTGQGKIQLTPNVLQPPLVDMWVALSPLLGARTSIFASSTSMALEAPLLGQGTGNFAWVYPNYSNLYPDFRDSLSSTRTFTTNPHNVVLQIASQNGIPAVIIFIGLLLYFWIKLFRSTWQKHESYLLAGLAALTAVSFDAMFNHVFFNPASMFVFALLMGSWWGSLPLANPKPNIQVSTKAIAVFTFSMMVLLSVWPLRFVVSEWYAGQAMAHARYPNYEVKFYQKAYNWDPENFRAVFGMGQVTYKQKNYKESARYFKAFEAFYPYNPPALNMLGAAYMMNGNLKEAEQAFKSALRIFPDFEMAQQNLQRVQAYQAQKKNAKP